jgi:hypothetical protein
VEGAVTAVDLTPLEDAYSEAVVAVLNACPQATEDEAEAVVDSLTKLIFTTMRTYLEEEKKHEPASH